MNTEKIMRLADEYAEHRHVHGSHHYNAYTAEARAALEAALASALTEKQGRTTGWAAPKDQYAVPVLFNPYTGEPRDVRDVQSDPQGVLIVPPGKVEMLAATSKQDLQVHPATVAEQEPLYLLHTGAIDSDGEQDEFDAEPDSYRRVEAYCRANPGITVGLYPHPAPVNQQSLTEEQIIMALENRGRRGYGPYEEGFFDGAEFAEKHHGIAAAEGKV